MVSVVYLHIWIEVAFDCFQSWISFAWQMYLCLLDSQQYFHLNHENWCFEEVLVCSYFQSIGYNLLTMCFENRVMKMDLLHSHRLSLQEQSNVLLNSRSVNLSPQISKPCLGMLRFYCYSLNCETLHSVMIFWRPFSFHSA